ncbi:MAG: hypothetical protein J0M24_22810 [Verrucomicrobia bacterium]|nr:hypothetical protein [Verrucomicrobiota bacterium]
MAWFRRKKSADPLTLREQELEAEIERLRREVGRLAHEAPQPAALPPAPVNSPETRPRNFAEPVRPTLAPDVEKPKGHYNEFGVAKFDLSAVLRRWLSHVRGPTSSNPRMAKMLAAGSIQGLRTLRYERRVARNRFIALSVILLLILWGLAYTYLRNR